MAILQISRITNRKGLDEDLPQPLAPAELGWAVDTRQLYIGPGTLAEGSPDEHNNIEILTEYSDILATQTAYTYQGAAAGYAVQTGITVGSPVSQSLQSRLDSYCVVTDFGATGNGVTDDTAAINLALYQLYCVQANPQIRRSLFFPAGSYLITDTILVPPYAMLYGDGPNSSIMNFFVSTWTNTVAYAAGVLVKSGGSYYRSNFAVPVGTGLSDQVSGQYYWGDITTGAANGLPEYIMQTASSTQQTGVNIVSPLEPQNILVTNMNMTTNQIMNGLLIERAHDCAFTNVSIQGALTTSELDSASDDIAAVRWASTTTLVNNHVNFENCSFSGFTYGTNTAQQIKGVTISNCKFDTLYQGAYLGGTSPVNGGPTGVRLIANTFDNIYVEGVVIDGVSLNSTTNNVFYDVGNHFNGAASPASAIIDIDAINNISVGDVFERTTTYSNTYPRIKLNNTNSIALGMNISDITFYQSNVANLTFANQMALGTYQRSSGIQDNLTVSGSAQTLFTFDADNIAAVKIDYTTVTDSNNAVRTGTFTIVRSTSDSTGALASSDSGIENSATGVTFSVSEDASTSVISWKYITSNSGTINYSVTKLA